MFQKIHPNGLRAFQFLAPKWKDHKVRLGLVFCPYLKMSLVNITIAIKAKVQGYNFKVLVSDSVTEHISI